MKFEYYYHNSLINIEQEAKLSPTHFNLKYYKNRLAKPQGKADFQEQRGVGAYNHSYAIS